MSETLEKLIELISPWVEPMGYEIVHIEVQTHQQKVLRIFIDHPPGTGKTIGIEDCVNVTKGLEEPLEKITELEKVFRGAYELEVSSPGLERPLRKASDYTRFSGQEARIHVFRPLTAEELGNEAYQGRNPKQKNFLGTLMGLQNDKVRLAVSAGKQEVHGKKGKAAKKALPATNSADEVTIPLPLISKANLEPDFEKLALELEDSRKKEKSA